MDIYLNASIILTRGGIFARRKIARRKKDVDGNTIFWVNQNIILDNRQYEVEFTDGEVTELTSNGISELIYAQCDKDGNDVLLLNYFVDCRKRSKCYRLKIIN